MITVAINASAGITSMQLSDDEKSSPYKQKKNSWISNKSYQRAHRLGIPTSLNIIGSHVVQKRKQDGLPKAKIVPRGYHEIEQNNLRADAPSLDIDTIRLVIFLAAENNWAVRKVHVNGAYLRAKGF